MGLEQDVADVFGNSPKKGKKSLYDIVLDICGVENGLAYMEIGFSYGKLAATMKPGHPADILDDIIYDIGTKLFLDHNAEIPLQDLVKLSENLKLFQKAFSVKEIRKPIRELDAYIESMKQDND